MTTNSNAARTAGTPGPNLEAAAPPDGPFSLVLPCYNEALSLPVLVGRAVACARRRGMGPDAFRLIPVENGSTDDSRQVLQALARGPDGAYLHPVWVPRNQGYGHGVMSGLRSAPRGIVGWTHADEQCDPEDAFRAWEIVRDATRPSLVKGRRHGRARSERLVSAGFAALATLTFARRMHEINAQPKVFPSDLIDRLDAPPMDFCLDIYVLVRAGDAGYDLAEIDVTFPPRRHGTSNWAGTLRSRARTMAGFVRYMLRLRAGGR